MQESYVAGNLRWDETPSEDVSEHIIAPNERESKGQKVKILQPFR
jgi:hypothetical protein